MRDQLEAAIDANPDLADTYLVLGDWLQERQDPRGELIGLHRDLTEAAKARIAALQRELGPPPPPYGSWAWFYGFVRRYQDLVSEDDRGRLAAVLDDPSLRHLHTLELGLGGREYDERQWLIDLLASKARPAWRSVRINSYWTGGNDPPAGALELTKLWAALPRVTRVVVAARTILPGEIRSETLTELELDGSVLPANLAPLFAGSAPNLTKLVLHDVGASIGMTLEKGITLPLATLALPHLDARTQERIVAKYPFATFAKKRRGDRYAQLGE